MIISFKPSTLIKTGIGIVFITLLLYTGYLLPLMLYIGYLAYEYMNRKLQ